MSEIPQEQWVIVDEADGTRWVADAGFLASTWECIWGRGCQGIGDEVAPALMHGCCSVGAEMTDETDAANVAAHAACIPDGLWQHAALAEASPFGPFRDATRAGTTVIDGVCIFFNRVEFAGGAGCALHLAANALGESHVGWKPNVCWQVPIKIDEHRDDEGRTVLVLRRWRSEDWGEDSQPAWWCTEAAEAYDGSRSVGETMAIELTELCGVEVVAELTRERS